MYVLLFQIATLFWSILFFGLPTLSMYLSFYIKTDRLQAAIIGAVVKPLYAFGMGIGMLGMSYNIGGNITLNSPSHHRL